MSDYHFDYETSSLCDIRLGSYRYGCDPSTRILLAAVAKDDADPVVWRFDQQESEESRQAVEWLSEAVANGSRIYAHNAQFEVAVSEYKLVDQLGLLMSPTLDQWRCTQAMCRRAAIPESLGDASKFLKLTDQKDSIGKALIGVFSDRTKIVTLEPPAGMVDPSTQKVMKSGALTKGKKPVNVKSESPILDDVILWDWTVKVSGQKMTVREAWNLFIEYCRQDVKVERQVHRKLSKFELEGPSLTSFQRNLRVNHLGVPVNIQALKTAQTMIEQYQEKFERRMFGMCGFRSSQSKKLLSWLRERGYQADNLQSETVEKAVSQPGNLTPLALEVLKCRALLSFAAIKKIPTILAAACPDGRVRGTTLWHGARTGRETGKIMQAHNVKKATIGDSDYAYELICDGASLEDLEFNWSSPLEAIASSIRHFIQPHEGKVLDGDYIGVEGRLTPWMAGDTVKLQSILDGVDPYKSIASKIFKVPYDEVTKPQRTIAKPVELGCCFGVGGRGLRESLANPPYNIQRTLAECVEYVKIYRDNHKPTVEAWKAIEEAAKLAIREHLTTEVLDGKLKFGYVRTAGIEYLVMRLPSGRRLYYPRPELKNVFKKYDEEDMLESEWKRERGGYWIEQISFYGRHEGKWGRIHTWGSRLFENAIQATGFDLLDYGCLQAEKEGYRIFLNVHDQSLAHDDLPLEGFLEAMCRKEPWAETFPLAADGAVHPYYLKD